MPIPSPAGPLNTLEEIVAGARENNGAELEQQYQTPVLLVVAPAEGWAQITAVKPSTADRPVSVSMLPTIVIKCERKKINPTEGRLTLGRSGACDVLMPFSALSKVHAFLTEVATEWTFEDAGSRNGTVVDGNKLIPGHAVRLRDGATLRFGDVTSKFLLPAAFCSDLRRRLER